MDIARRGSDEPTRRGRIGPTRGPFGPIDPAMKAKDVGVGQGLGGGVDVLMHPNEDRLPELAHAQPPAPKRGEPQKEEHESRHEREYAGVVDAVG